MPEPKFLADPAHRKKTLWNRLCKLLGRKKANRCGFTEMDIVWLTTNFVYMTHSLNSICQSEWEDAAAAALEHHFDNHIHCGEFCKRLKELRGELEVSDKFHRSKTSDSHLCAALNKTMSEFVTLKRLGEVAHTCDTNVNEALNNVIAWLAPKNKTHCRSDSLLNRVSIGICIFVLGFEEFFVSVFKELGIEMDASTRCHVTLKERQRKEKSEKARTNKAKVKRNDRVHNELKQHMVKAKEERAKGLAHAAGIGFEDDSGNKKKKKKKKKSAKKPPPVLIPIKLPPTELDVWCC